MPATLKEGSTGPDVSQWQQLLTDQHFATEVTGVFDQATVAATKAWQKAKGLVSDGVVGPKSWAAMTGQTVKSYPPDYAKNAKFGREAILQAWPHVMEKAAASSRPEVRALVTAEPPLAVLQIIQGQGHLESHYGKSSYTNKTTGDKSGVINNWGAVQAGPPPCNPAESFEATDTGPSGSYTYCYQKYGSAAEGAAHMIEHMTIKRPHSWAAMLVGDIDEWARRMHSWNPPLTKLGPGGKAPGAKPNVDPITGTKGYFEQPPDQRAKGIEERIWAISDALGEPVAAKRGGPMPTAVETPGPTLSPAAKKAGWAGLAIVLVTIGLVVASIGIRRLA